jgi:hypothetical protein
MLELIWESGKTIFGWISEMKKNKREINKDTSIFLSEISDLLGDTAKKLDLDQYPHDNCVQMKVLSDNLIQTLQGKMDENVILQLQQNLDLASKLEMLYAERKDPKIIIKLKECKGMFKGLSQITKLTD